MLGVRDLRAFCRRPMGVPVAFAGVSTYPDDGSEVCGLFDRAVSIDFQGDGIGGMQSAAPQLRLPFNAFEPMPSSGDTVSVTDEGVTTVYQVNAPITAGDGGFQLYELMRTADDPTVAIEASADNGQSVASDVLDTVVAALGENAFRCRFRDFAVKDLPADNVLPDTDSPEYICTDDAERTFRFMVRHMAVAVDGADKLADARYVRAAQLLNNDPALRGMVRSIREVGSKWEMEQKEFQIVALVVTYEVEFATSRRDPSVAGF